MKNEKIGAEEIYLAPEATEDSQINNEDSSDEIEATHIAEIESKGNMKSVRVNELLDLRGENLKVFRMSDGSEQAVFFPEAVHVLSKDTKTYDDVDNTIIMEEDRRHYIGGGNRFKARFSCDDGNDELFSIESGMHRVTVSAKKNKKQLNKGVKPHMHKKSIDGVNKSDSLKYENVQQGADYEYSVNGSGVKENIVVKEKAEVYRFPFIIHQENVTSMLDETNKSISFISNETGEEVFFIPAPFMVDSNDVVSTAVSYELKPLENGDVILTVAADRDFMNAEDRAFPVIIDPQIKLSASSAMTTYSWNNGNLYSNTTHAVGTTGNGDGTCNAKRMYLKFNMPTLPRNPRIKKAELVFTQAAGTTTCEQYPKFGLFRVNEEICTGNCTPIDDSSLIDFAKMKVGHMENGAVITYAFDVTTLVDMVNKNEIHTQNLVMKMLDETNDCTNSITLYGSSSGTYAPQFVVTYESTYGVNTSYRTHTHEFGRFGQGSIDLQCGNLMLESDDFAWAGNRMPVTIKHLFNSALAGYQYTANSAIKLLTAGFSAMKVGLGYKLNIMQSMVATTFQHEGTVYEGYVYIGENGEETYFKKSDEQVCCDSNSQCYNLYEDVNGGDMLYDPEKLTLTQGSEVYLFDASGRLIQIKDENGNHMDITYTSGRITSVTDGAGRDFGFAYNGNGFLTSITAPDNTSVLYDYTGNLLTTVTYPDGKKATISYSSNKPSEVVISDAAGNNVYKVEYSFSGNRVVSVAEYGVENGNFVVGNQSAYSYSVASARTLVTTTEQADGDDAANTIKTVYTFDDDGNIVSEYVYSENTGNTGVEGEESGIHPHSGDGGVGVVSNINNLLIGHSFESLDAWSEMSSNCGDVYISNYANVSYTKFGKKLLRMQSYNADCTENGMYQTSISLPAGEYTFSAYLRVLSTFSGGATPGAYIRVTDTSGNILAESEHLSKYDSEFTRLIAPFTLAIAQSVQVQILMNGRGTVYVDAAQLENNPYANAYNMLENGNFERSSGWNLYGASYTSGTRFNMSRALMMTGNLEANRYASQQVTVKTSRSTRETFTLSGWAKGYGLPNHERDGISTPPTFRLRADVKYYDTYYREYNTETFTADFSPCTEEWQFASIQFSKSKYRTIQYITVYCDYGYNTGTVYFDDIQLTRDSLETYLSASDFVVESTGTSDEVAEEQDTTPTFNEAKDRFGNALTETTFTDGEFGTIYRAFKFNEDDNCCPGDDAGNNLIEETDARGNKTSYAVDSDTSRNEEVVDRLGNKTAYEYDNGGKTTKVTSKDKDNNEIANVSYAYDTFDNMTEIARGDGLKYALAYNAFNNLESIGIDGKNEKLVKYTYKNGNGRLKEIKYANCDTMKATYNSAGQMTAEKWFNAANALTAHYKYVYDGKGNIVRSIDILAEKEYNYEYEDGKIVRATECDITLNGDVVTSKVIVNTVKYYYDNEGKQTKKVITPASGSAQTIYFESNDDNTVVKFSAGGRTVTSHSKSDSFGRKTFDELQLGTDFVSRQFVYHAGKITAEHKSKSKVKSSATTQLVSQIILSNGTTLSYGYDAEERITSVVESYTVDDTPVTNTTTYTYDALGQLLTETVNGTVVNEMTYDNYGNILTKNGVAYTYDSTWKDLLTGYGEQTITYDAQGNPTSYLGHTLTWEKGRQLKSFDGNSYTYNANGIRTSKKVNGVLHTYTLDGTKILREVWDGNVLVPLYDNEDSVCGILYNNIPYYFIKNLQGDVVAIVDKDATTVAKYSYDAWGVCTISQDTSDCSVATVNPYRYRSYYYDAETQMYYLQSRHYNPVIGRFVNVDTAEILEYPSTSRTTNLFSYCDNNPTNDTDRSGTFLASKLAEIFLSAVFGMVAQLFDDLVIYFLQVLVHGKTKAKFNPNPSDYVSRALSWALECVNPFSGKKKWLNVILAIAPLVVKTIWDLVAGKGFDLWSFLRNLFYSLASVIIANVLGRRAKNEIAKLKKHYRGRKPAYKAKKLQIKANYKVLGNKISAKIDIAAVVVETVLAVLFI